MSKLPLLPLLVDNVSDAWITVLRQVGISFTRRTDRNANAGRFVLFDSRRTNESKLKLLPRQTAIDVARLGADNTQNNDESWQRISRSLDPRERSIDSSAAARDRRAAWRSFPIGDGTSVTERVSRCDHASHRRRMMVALRKAIEQAGGVWLTVSPYPFPYRSMFNFRVDHDRYAAEDFAAMMTMLERLDGQSCTSHFISGAAFNEQRRPLRRLREWDVGSHGYHHHTYRTTEENLRNIERGIETLRRAGIDPQGFVAPGGVYNPAIAEAMDQIGVGHSGEFSLVYDDLPLTPVGRQTLQIPIHPVCLGLFLDSEPQADIASVVAYFERTIDRFYATGRPIMLYGHPTGRLGVYPELIRAIFSRVASLGAVWRTTQSRLTQWWESREAIQITVLREGGDLVVRAAGLPRKPQVGIEIRKKKLVARIPMQRQEVRICPAELGWEPDSHVESADETNVEPASVRVAAPGGVRGRIRRLLDWEYETPWQEIPTSNLRNIIKRALRRMKSADSTTTSEAARDPSIRLPAESAIDNDKRDKSAA